MDVNVGIAHETRKATIDICHEGKRELPGIGGCKWALNGNKEKVKGDEHIQIVPGDTKKQTKKLISFCFLLRRVNRHMVQNSNNGSKNLCTGRKSLLTLASFQKEQLPISCLSSRHILAKEHKALVPSLCSLSIFKAKYTYISRINKSKNIYLRSFKLTTTLILYEYVVYKKCWSDGSGAGL